MSNFSRCEKHGWAGLNGCPYCEQASGSRPSSCLRKELEDAINIVRDELREAGISNMVDGPEKVAKCIDRASRNFHTVAKALGYDWLSGKISSANS